MVTKDIKSRKAAETKTKKSPPSHPTYLEMIGEALGSLKERTGSSQMAIAKFIEEKHKEYHLPPNFKKLLSVQLKKLIASGRLTKIKNSYKLTASAKNPKPATAVAKPKAKVVAKPKVKSPAKKASKVLPAKKKVVTAALPKKRATPAKNKVVAAVKPKVKSVKKAVKSPAKKVVAKKVKK